MNVGNRAIVDRASKSSAKKRIGVAGQLLHLAAGLVAIVVLIVFGAVGFYLLEVAPRERAAQAEARRAAEAFGRLKGKERRLAIYDAFVAQVSEHYYDQNFTGFDWPKLRRAGRVKAALASDDWHLYWDVLVPMTQEFPASHMFAAMPGDPIGPVTAAKVEGEAGSTVPPPPVPCTDKDAGVQIVPLRRGKGVGLVIGEVLPGSPAARAGMTPGWSVLDFSEKAGRSGHRIEATLLRLMPGQMHLLETAGSIRFRPPRPGMSAAENTGYFESLRTKIRFDFTCGSAWPPFATRMLPGGIRYIRFDRFEPLLVDKVRQALQQTGAAGAVLDLRFNEGGYPLLLLDTLLPAKTPVYAVKDAAGVHAVRTGGGTERYTGPLAILVGPSSASAAEMSAAVLKSNQRAVIIGRRTNGSVLGAGFYPLPDGGQVEVAVQDIIMRDGTRLEATGMAPDVEIYPPIEALRSGRDPAVSMAVQILLRRPS